MLIWLKVWPDGQMDLANNNLPQLAKQPIHPMNNIVLKYQCTVCNYYTL